MGLAGADRLRHSGETSGRAPEADGRGGGCEQAVDDSESA
jgi:hypothetical protein